MRKVYLFGDSIGHGVVYNEERRRYCLASERCTRALRERGADIEDYSRMGATVLDGCEAVAEAPIAPGDIAVIEFGGNDCDMDWAAVAAAPDAEHDARVPLEQFAAGLRRCVASVRGRGGRPVLAIPTPLLSDRYYRWVSQDRDAEAILRFLGDAGRIYRWQELYADTVREVAAREDCEILDVRAMMLARPDLPRLMCVDGIHPNNEGHGYLSRQILSGPAVPLLAG